jgi:hypothetical protein
VLKNVLISILLIVAMLIPITRSGLDMNKTFSALAHTNNTNGSIYDKNDTQTVSSSTVTAIPSMPPPFQISDGHGYAPALAYNSVHDEYLAVWWNPWHIYAQRMTSRGELVGDEITIYYSSNRNKDPSVAYDPGNDRYLVVWLHEVTSSNWDVYGRFIPWDGNNPTSNEFVIDSSTIDSSNTPKVVYALNPQEYLVVWEDYSSGWPEYRIRGRRIMASGGGMPAKFLIADNPSANRSHPDVAYNLARNEYLVVYDNYYYGTNNENIYGKRFTYNEIVLGGGEFSIASWPDDELKPAVAACHLADQYFVTWTSNQVDSAKVYGRFIDGDGGIEQVQQIASPTTGYPFTQAPIACLWGVQYLITWESLEIGTHVGISGRYAYWDFTFNPIFEIAEPHDPHRESPAIICGSDNCLAAWEEYDSSLNAEIYGRIIGDTKPKADFSINPLNGNMSTLYQFDASASNDIEDPSSNLEVRWDWEDDGFYDTNWSTTKNATHQYTLPCFASLMFVNVRLQVRDSSGLKDSIIHTLGVGNTPPIAGFTVTPPIGDNTTYFEFDASSSSDLECATSDLEFRWDWESDGTWDTNWSTNLITIKNFNTASYGWYNTRLEVRDSPGLTDEILGGFMIDHAPIADFTVSPTSGDTNTIFQFDPSSSSDPDLGPPPCYALHTRWDWEDDGIWDTGWGMCSQIVEHTFNFPGTYTVRLEVRYVEPSLRDSTTRQVIVSMGSNGLYLYLPLIIR